MSRSPLIHAAIQNGSSSGQFAVAGKTINVATVVEMLESGAGRTRHPAIRAGSRQLLERMACTPWRVSAGPHTGGHGGGGFKPDENMHITVSVGGRGYHIRLDKRGIPWWIVGVGIQAVAPWIGPGQPV